MTPFPRANGTLPLPIRQLGVARDLTFYGGPFRAGFVADWLHFGICLTEDGDPRADRHVPIEDFSVPTQDPAVVAQAVKDAILAALDGRDVYAGCMGGWGRTGLFLSLVAKACGQDDPVTYVRRLYTPRAVETAEQMRYVAEFDVTAIRRWLRFEMWRRALIDIVPTPQPRARLRDRLAFWRR